MAFRFATTHPVLESASSGPTIPVKRTQRNAKFGAQMSGVFWATNLLMPIGLSLAVSGGLGLNPILVAFFIAIAASSAMALPVSTPPNAIAYSTGAVTTKNMALTGIAVGAASLLLFFLIAPTIWSMLGVS